MEIPNSARKELESMSEDELDFLEREIFYAYDQSYAAYKQDNIDNLEELALYERALETISSIRRIKQSMNEEKIEQGKEIEDLLNKIE
jgi:hypothetical protein